MSRLNWQFGDTIIFDNGAADSPIIEGMFIGFDEDMGITGYIAFAYALLRQSPPPARWQAVRTWIASPHNMRWWHRVPE